MFSNSNQINLKTNIKLSSNIFKSKDFGIQNFISNQIYLKTTLSMFQIFSNQKLSGISFKFKSIKKI